MNPLVASSTLSLFTRLAAVHPETLNHTGGAGSLSTVDDILFVLAVGILVLSIGRWLTRSRQNPLISAPERPNTVREDAVALAVVTYFLGAMVMSGMVSFAGGRIDGSLGEQVIGNGADLAGLAACVYVAATCFDGGVLGCCFGCRRSETIRSAAMVLGLSVVAIVMCPLIRDVTASSIVFFLPDYVFQSHPTVVALHDPSQSILVRVAFWAGAALIAPVAEEFFFRGLLQTFLATAFRSRWAAIVVASILFGSVHVRQPSAIPALVVLAVLMGFAYEKTGALVWPVMIHAAFNLKTLIWDAVGGSAI